MQFLKTELFSYSLENIRNVEELFDRSKTKTGLKQRNPILLLPHKIFRADLEWKIEPILAQ